MPRKHFTEQGARNAQVEEQGNTNDLIARLLAEQGSAKALLAQLLTEQQRTNQLLEWLGQVIQQGQQHP